MKPAACAWIGLPLVSFQLVPGAIDTSAADASWATRPTAAASTTDAASASSRGPRPAPNGLFSPIFSPHPFVYGSSGGQSHAAAQPDVPGTAADHDAVRTGADRPTVAGRVPVAERAGVQRHGDVAGLARTEQDLLEALEFLRCLGYRSAGRRTDEQLDDLRSGPRAGVGDVGLDGHVRAASLRHLEVGVGEAGVRQAEPEREQRRNAVRVVVPVPDEDALGVLRRTVDAGIARGSVRGLVGILLREGDRQFPGRVERAEQDVGHRVAVFLARVPGLQYRRHLAQPRNQYRPDGPGQHDRARVG